MEADPVELNVGDATNAKCWLPEVLKPKLALFTVVFEFGVFVRPY